MEDSFKGIKLMCSLYSIIEHCVDSLATTNDVIVVNPYEQFSHACSCYEMMPDSIKMVVLDKRLPMRKAFFALVQNGE